MASDLFAMAPQNIVYDGLLFHEGFDPPVLDRITSGDFQLRETDILIAGFPKAGTSWLTKILLLLCRPDEMETSHEMPLEFQHGFLELTPPGHPPQLDAMENMPNPRIIKSHLPPRMFSNQKNVTSKRTKIINIVRNPNDLLVSYYNFARMNGYLGKFTGTWSQFFELYQSGQLVYGDPVERMPEWWQQRDRYNLINVKYEDLHKDAAGCVRDMASFLDLPLTDEHLARILELSSFASMAKNKILETLPKLDHSISPFMRKGQVGDWKNYFTTEENAYMDAQIKEKIEPTGLKLDYQV